MSKHTISDKEKQFILNMSKKSKREYYEEDLDYPADLDVNPTRFKHYFLNSVFYVSELRGGAVFKVFSDDSEIVSLLHTELLLSDQCIMPLKEGKEFLTYSMMPFGDTKSERPKVEKIGPRE
jgi:hypothetical protein